MNRIKYQVSSKILLAIYNSLILSHLHYGILCWGVHGNRLFKLQKKAIRIICKAKYNAHTDPLFKRLKLLKILDIHKLQCLKFYFRLTQKILPSYFIKNFKLVRNFEVREHDLRSRLKFRIQRTNKQTTKKAMRFFLPDLLNNTENTHLVSSVTLDTFKKKIKSSYLDNYASQCHKIRCYICAR